MTLEQEGNMTRAFREKYGVELSPEIKAVYGVSE